MRVQSCHVGKTCSHVPTASAMIGAIQGPREHLGRGIANRAGGSWAISCQWPVSGAGRPRNEMGGETRFCLQSCFRMISPPPPSSWFLS